MDQRGGIQQECEKLAERGTTRAPYLEVDIPELQDHDAGVDRQRETDHPSLGIHEPRDRTYHDRDDREGQHPRPGGRPQGGVEEGGRPIDRADRQERT